MPDKEKVIDELNTDVLPFLQHHCDMQCCREKRWISKMIITVHDALVLLNGQDAKERKWLQAIADNQIANAPKDSPMSLDEQLKSEYKSGIYDGLQMAFEILTEGR